MAIDCLILVPLEPLLRVSLLDAVARKTMAARLLLPIARAGDAFEEYLGFKPARLLWKKNEAFFHGEQLRPPACRTSSAIALASPLERAGLSWAAIDPGEQDLDYWRTELPKFRASAPRTIAVCSTFVITGEWLATFLSIARKAFPQSKLLIGGYFYANNTQHFLSLDADIMCIGEGEVRLPQIVAACRNGSTLDSILGLYYRKPDGSLQFTGRPEPLDLDALPPPDWDLAFRMHPTVRPSDSFYLSWETQRGCVFKCQYCTYRTLSVPNLSDAGIAVERVLNAPHLKHGFLSFADATFTYPQARFERFLELVIERGGFPGLTQLNARVNDVTEANASLMRQAGVTAVFIGQESGDQRVLGLMRKGTSARLFKPAMLALAHNRINALVTFIHGFPGETPDAARNTRQMVQTMNDGVEHRPPGIIYGVNPFFNQDLADVKQKHDGLRNQGYFADDTGPLDEVLETFLAVSRVPHGPVEARVCEAVNLPADWVANHPRAHDLRRWCKAIERGVAIFLERDLEGTLPNGTELRRLREDILAPLSGTAGWTEGMLTRVAAPLRRHMMHRLEREFQSEDDAGVGIATRALMAAVHYRDQADFSSSLRTFRTGLYQVPGGPLVKLGSSENAARVAELSDDLTLSSLAAPGEWVRSDRFRQQLKQLRVPSR